jgi:hypothetical protein
MPVDTETLDRWATIVERVSQVRRDDRALEDTAREMRDAWRDALRQETAASVAKKSEPPPRPRTMEEERLLARARRELAPSGDT